VCEAGRYFGGCNGKGNRILYSAKLSQVFEVVPSGSTREAAGVFAAGAQIGVTTFGYPHITHSYAPGAKVDEIQGLRYRWKGIELRNLQLRKVRLPIGSSPNNNGHSG
jgi:hypothetical protein